MWQIQLCNSLLLNKEFEKEYLDSIQSFALTISSINGVSEQKRDKLIRSPRQGNTKRHLQYSCRVAWTI